MEVIWLTFRRLQTLFLKIFYSVARDDKQLSNEVKLKTGAKLNDESPLAEQVHFDVLVCHGSESNRCSYHDSDFCCDSMADG